MVERLVLFLFPLGSVFCKEYLHFVEILVILVAFQILCRWIAFGGNERYAVFALHSTLLILISLFSNLLVKAWLSFVLPCYHFKPSMKETTTYLALHGLGCQALILVLYWYWPEILPIWNTDDMANLRSVIAISTVSLMNQSSTIP